MNASLYQPTAAIVRQSTDGMRRDALKDLSPPQGQPRLFIEAGEYVMLILVCGLFVTLGAFAVILAFG